MSTNSSSQLRLVEEQGWKRGFANLLRGEYSAWFQSSKWWKQLILWFSIINLMMVMMLYASGQAAQDGGSGPPTLFMYGIFGGMFVAFGVMILMQRAIIKEKQSGTAAWVLSKPVTRTAFVISRLAINTIGILITAVIVPGVLFYITLGTLSDFGWLPPLGSLIALLMIIIHTFFWITLVLMNDGYAFRIFQPSDSRANDTLFYFVDGRRVSPKLVLYFAFTAGLQSRP